jgi:hypothetical protein
MQTMKTSIWVTRSWSKGELMGGGRRDLQSSWEVGGVICKGDFANHSSHLLWTPVRSTSLDSDWSFHILHGEVGFHLICCLPKMLRFILSKIIKFRDYKVLVWELWDLLDFFWILFVWDSNSNSNSNLNLIGVRYRNRKTPLWTLVLKPIREVHQRSLVFHRRSTQPHGPPSLSTYRSPLPTYQTSMCRCQVAPHASFQSLMFFSFLLRQLRAPRRTASSGPSMAAADAHDVPHALHPPFLWNSKP